MGLTALEATPSANACRPGGRIRNLTWILFILGSLALLGASCYRAATFPFTHDESLSFAIFSWQPAWGKSANNHLLNTFLMQWCSKLFGDSELSLRLPNLLAHAIYLLCTVGLIRRLDHSLVQITGFALLNLNPFLLDFFFLARGYGLALAFMLLSLYSLLRAFEEHRQAGTGRYAYLCALAGSLAVLANFSFLNYFLPLLLADTGLLLTDASSRRLNRSRIAAGLGLLSAGGLFIAVIISRLLQLSEQGQLYFGGRSGFIEDTVGSLVRASLYVAPYADRSERALCSAVIAAFLACFLLGLYLLFSRKEVTRFTLSLGILAVAVALPIFQHRFFSILFPIERAALYYLPLYAALLTHAFDEAAKLCRRRWQKMAILALPLAVAAISCWHFCHSFDTRFCYNWWYDAHNHEVLEIIDRDRARNFPGRTVTLGNSWLMEPSLNFYRITRNYTWLSPVTRMPIRARNNDYVYAFEPEVAPLLGEPHVKLASYRDTQTVLLRMNAAPRLPQRRPGTPLDLR